jgi:hypothetical protein
MEPSWPGLSRPSRLRIHGALLIEIAGTSPAMTALGISWKLTSTCLPTNRSAIAPDFQWKK